MFSAHFFFWKGVGVGENPNCWISPVVVTPVVPSWNAGNSHPCWCCTNVWHVDSVIPVICSLALTLFEPFWPLIQLDLIDWLIVETHLCHACSIHPGRHGKMIDDPHWLSKIKRQAAVCSSTRSCISRFQESIFVQSPKASFDAPGREVNILEAQTWYDSDADTPPTVVFPVSHDYQNLWGLMLDEFPDPKQKHFAGFLFSLVVSTISPFLTYLFQTNIPIDSPSGGETTNQYEIWRKTNRPLCACATLRCVSLGNYGAPATKPVRLGL